MDPSPPHERLVLDLWVKSQLGFKCFASVAELHEVLVVFIQAFFAFSKVKTWYCCRRTKIWSWWNCRPPLHPTKLFVCLFSCDCLRLCDSVMMSCCGHSLALLHGEKSVQDQCLLAWFSVERKGEKKKHFLLCVWVLRSVTSGSKVNFLQDPLSGLSYSTVDCVGCGLARTLLSII